MLVISPFCESDFQATLNLDEWIAHLGKLSNHKVLLLASRGISDAQIREMNDVAKASFSSVTAIRQSSPDPKRWPQGPNSMFSAALEWVKKFHNAPWLWLESDMVPMSPGWLDRLEEDYKRRSMPFYGTIYNLPFRHLNGGAIYPANTVALNPYILGASERPFDCVRPDITLRHAYNSPLMQRELADPKSNQPFDFPTQESISRVILPGVQLFHGSKNGALIARLRERNGELSPSQDSKRSLKVAIKRFFGAPAPELEKRTITIRRTGAIGDALAATCVANKLIEQGHRVIVQCHPSVQPVLKYVPGIHVADVSGECDVNLDNCYEQDKNRTTRHFADMFIESANRQLARHRITLQPLNIAPKLAVKARERVAAMCKYSDLPRKWVGFAPRSNSFLVRTVVDGTWQRASEYIRGATCFWLGTHPAPNGNIVDLELRDIGLLVRCVANLDLVVGVDSGVVHVSIALGIPTIVIGQSSSPELHFSDQRDFETIYPMTKT